MMDDLKKLEENMLTLQETIAKLKFMNREIKYLLKV